MNWLLIIIYILIIFLIAFLGRGKLKVKRDFFFIFFVFQGITYLFIIPSITNLYIQEKHLDYMKYQILILFFFFIPMILIYRLLVLKVKYRSVKENIIWRKKGLVFSLFLLFFEILFVLKTIDLGLIFKRIGTYGLAARQASLNLVDLFITRSHDLAILPILGYLIYIQVRYKSGKNISRRTKRILLIPLIICGAVYLVYVMINSRGMLIISSVFIYGVWVVFSDVKSIKIIRRSLGISLLVIFGVILVSNIRYYIGSGDSFMKIFNPLYSFRRLDPSENKKQWLHRLDGIALIYKFDEGGLTSSGYELGAAWKTSAIVTVTQFVAPDISRKYKILARTTPKSYLIEKYTDLDPGDFPSCMLTDAYGNFGVLGFFFAAIFSSCCFAVLSRLLLKGKSQGVLIAMFFGAHLMIFERSFFYYILGWIKLLPILFILLVVNPINYKKKVMK